MFHAPSTPDIKLYGVTGNGQGFCHMKGTGNHSSNVAPIHSRLLAMMTDSKSARIFHQSSEGIAGDMHQGRVVTAFEIDFGNIIKALVDDD